MIENGLDVLDAAVAQPLPCWLDHSVMCDYQVCWRRGWWRHQAGVMTEGRQTALEFGGSIHCGLRAWYETRDLNAAILAFGEEWRARGGDDPADAKRTREKGIKILTKYSKKWPEGEFEVVATETTGAKSVEGLPVPYVFKIDLLARTDVGVWVVDHKTSSWFSPLLLKSVRPNAQFVGYVSCAEVMFGEPIAGLIANWILVSTSKEDFLREFVDYEEWERDWWRFETARFWSEFAERHQGRASLGALLRAFPRNPQMCTTYYGECPYRPLCVTEPKEEYLAKELEVGFRVERWEPMEMVGVR